MGHMGHIGPMGHFLSYMSLFVLSQDREEES